MKTAAAFLASAVISAFGLGATSTPQAAVPIAQCVNISRSLFLGSEDKEVKALQIFLGVRATGYFGHITKQKLIQWQISKTIIRSAKSVGAGVAGPKTRAAMKCITPKATPAPAPSATPVVQTITQTVASTTPTPIVAPVEAPASSGGAASGGGSGGAIPSPSIYTCPVLGAKPAGDQCSTGEWEKVQDEADCDIWYCSEPASDQG